jgi:hypothetical protein
VQIYVGINDVLCKDLLVTPYLLDRRRQKIIIKGFLKHRRLLNVQ